MERVKENRDWKSHLGNWGIYAAAAGASLSMATSADAGIISGTLNLTASNNPAASIQGSGLAMFAIGGHGVQLGVVNNAAHTNFNSTSRGMFCSGPMPGCMGTAVPREGAAFLTANLKLFESPGTIVRRYLRNSAIVGGAPAAEDFGFLDVEANGVQRDPFPFNNTNDFVGFRTAGGDLGWLQVEVLDRNGDGYADEVKAIAYGYNTVAGASILAGQTSSAPATPEPGTASLALLAAGAAGSMALRQARRARTKI
jgi:hypothetical protein